ncbi:hypothetical protein H310_11044 [Aphanomyces invadans]|uniref:JmjC domain-containing protein n=1 Tax=Aphanomyces invadans TaxID=157072 RepID=A0A024TNM7_9STRA|nr:hypothetical protein H310_11044 [Aphanomyces invadans]ETV95614.1 hypothetical protein H310_11044 [Aphanomyces invadans]|eukprot:XP_008875807.1 hypothetical protein H310_11044 [Aphanomyces invadans]
MVFKRQRIDGDVATISHQGASCGADSRKDMSTRMQHPLGVKPWGNSFNDMDNGIKPCRPKGLGRLHTLPDTILHAIFGSLDPISLGITSSTSRAWYVFCYHDEFWRTLVLEKYGGAFLERTTWREAYIATSTPSFTPPSARRVSVQGFYSDLLFLPFYCAHTPLTLLSTHAMLKVNTIPRVDGSMLSVADFKAKYEQPNVPVILTNVVTKWPALSRWTDAYLAATCKDTPFYAGGFTMSIAKYTAYARTLRDDQPLFIFDKHFASTVPQLAADYTVPAYFHDDLFPLLGETERPDYRWLIFGPEGSGSSFHIDPNSTCAWNAVLRGRKKWIMFPPDVVPPGVHPSVDGGEVSTPVSLMEWFVTFYPQIKSLKDPVHGGVRHLEGVCEAGEMIFVPRGWWHIVLNLDESLAITQNYVSPSNVQHVLAFLHDKPDQVSGLDDETKRPLLYAKFRAALEKHHPEFVATFDESRRPTHPKKATWASLVQSTVPAEDGNAHGAAPFSFGFSGEDAMASGK